MHDPILLLHGGAGRASTPERQQQVAAALTAITDAVWPVLQDGGDALSAVVEAVARLEDDPLFNAGTGSKLQADGVPRLSASLMDGAAERFSGVVNVERLRNPIRLCRRLLDEPDRVLAGAGALERARALGLPEKDLRTPRSIATWEAARDGRTGTVGAVALDRHGGIAAGTSTGGRGMERVGRVSDSCTVAGNYATPRAACSMTGVGEHIVDGALAVRLVAAIEAGRPLEDARDHILDAMRARAWEAGFIVLTASGGWSVGTTTAAMSWRAVTVEGARDFQG